MNTKIMKAQIKRKIKYDHEGHMRSTLRYKEAE